MKTALVTGGAGEIGAEICRALHRDGYHVVLSYLKSRENAEKLASEIDGCAVQADARDPNALQRALDKIGGVDALITNAAIPSYGVFQNVADDWRAVFDVNAGGVVNAVSAVLPHMLDTKSGCIVTILSIWGLMGASCETIYSASKHAVAGLTKALALELAPSGIRVNGVAPGIVAAGMTTAQFSEPDFLASDIPSGVLGSPADVAELAAFLCSDGAKYITGQIIAVDGGYTLHNSFLEV